MVCREICRVIGVLRGLGVFGFVLECVCVCVLKVGVENRETSKEKKEN